MNSNGVTLSLLKGAGLALGVGLFESANLLKFLASIGGVPILEKFPLYPEGEGNTLRSKGLSL